MRTEPHVSAGVVGNDLSTRWCGFERRGSAIWPFREKGPSRVCERPLPGIFSELKYRLPIFDRPASSHDARAVLVA